MNYCFVCGRISSIGEVKTTKNDKKFLSFSIADPISKDKAQFISCYAMEKNAENIAKYFQKGDQIIIKGEMNVGTHKDSKLARTDIYVQNWEFGQKKKTESEKAAADSSSDDDDLPFGV